MEINAHPSFNILYDTEIELEIDGKVVLRPNTLDILQEKIYAQ